MNSLILTTTTLALLAIISQSFGVPQRVPRKSILNFNHLKPQNLVPTTTFPPEDQIRKKRDEESESPETPPTQNNPPAEAPKAGPDGDDESDNENRSLMNVTGETAANDKSCLNLHPCRSEHGEHEDEMRQYCWKYIDDESPDRLSLKCYDRDPIPGDDTENETITITHTTPVTHNDGYEGVGFIIPEDPILRHSKYFDMDGVGDRFYKDADGTIDFEFMDWPGKLMDSWITHLTAIKAKDYSGIGKPAECMQMIEFEGRSDKYINYICNDAEGLDIAALGLIGTESPPREDDLQESCPMSMLHLPDDEEEEEETTESDDEETAGNETSSSTTTTTTTTTTKKKKKEQLYNRVFNLRCNLPRNRETPEAYCRPWPIPSGKMYLAFGEKSMSREYLQPLLIAEDILRKLAQSGESRSPEPIPTFSNEVLQCNHFESRDIRTVLDFAFASDRLILGMKCGVILVKNLGGNSIDYDVAYLKTSDRRRADPEKEASHIFPYMINIVAATPCCTTNKMCRHLLPLVAIYSAYAAYRSYPDDYQFYRDILPKTIFISTDNGDTFDRRVVASPDASLNLMYWMYSKIPPWQVKNVRPPAWVQKYVFPKEQKLGDDIREPINAITKLVMQSVLPSEPGSDECYEIVSMASVSEENLLLVLCRYPRNETSNSTANTYAMFSVPIRGNIPLISLSRRSKRIFSCRAMPMKRVWGKYEGVMRIEPTLVRIPDSYSIFILGCEKTLYYSSNGGKTVFLRSFFFNDTEQAKGDQSEYVFSRSNKYLTSYPQVAIDSQGQRAMFTFGRYFAYGLTSSNTETTFICGPVLENLPGEVGKSVGDPIFIPYFSESDKAEVAVIYIDLLKKTGEAFYMENYKDRHAIRLLDARISVHGHSLPFYQEYAELSNSLYTMSPCTTYAFNINTSAISLDVGQSAMIHVSVKDNRKDVPLNVLLTHDKAASLRVASTKSTQKEDGMMQHEWEIELTAKPYVISRGIARVDGFFGAAYSNLEQVTAHLIINTQPQIRCHVQPRGHVTVRFGCNKYLAVHEDERRPQCETFKNNFRYEIPHGHYDPDMAQYWQSERPKFYKIENGTLKIIYDYEMFGCPVEPYRLDDYMPDLRLLPIGGSPNTSEGEVFKGEFVLIEVFGATGYSFKQKVRNADCTSRPQTLEEMIQEWRARTEALKATWYDYPHFDFDNVYAALNIWNPVNYVSCKGYQFFADDQGYENDDAEEPAADDSAPTEASAPADPEDPYQLGREVLESPYEVLTLAASEDKLNKITWDQAFRQRVYIFLAVGVDPYESYCTYHTYVAVSLAVPKEESDVILIIVFFCTLIVLLLLVIAGYYLRRHQVFKKFYKEAMFNRLLTAAWNLSFRYEKILLDSKITDPLVKQQISETKKLKLKKHSGLELEGSHGRRGSKVSDVRQRIKQ